MPLPRSRCHERVQRKLAANSLEGGSDAHNGLVSSGGRSGKLRSTPHLISHNLSLSIARNTFGLRSERDKRTTTTLRPGPVFLSTTERDLANTCCKCTKMHATGQSDAVDVDGLDWTLAFPPTNSLDFGLIRLSPIISHRVARVRRDRLRSSRNFAFASLARPNACISVLGTRHSLRQPEREGAAEATEQQNIVAFRWEPFIIFSALTLDGRVACSCVG